MTMNGSYCVQIVKSHFVHYFIWLKIHLAKRERRQNDVRNKKVRARMRDKERGDERVCSKRIRFTSLK